MSAASAAHGRARPGVRVPPRRTRAWSRPRPGRQGRRRGIQRRARHTARSKGPWTDARNRETGRDPGLATGTARTSSLVGSSAWPGAATTPRVAPPAARDREARLRRGCRGSAPGPWRGTRRTGPPDVRRRPAASCVASASSSRSPRRSAIRPDPERDQPRARSLRRRTGEEHLERVSASTRSAVGGFGVAGGPPTRNRLTARPEPGTLGPLGHATARPPRQPRQPRYRCRR